MPHFSFAALLLALLTLHSAFAQIIPAPTRSGATAATPPAAVLRRFPCAGSTIFEDSFNGAAQPALPAGWQALDFDNADLNPNITGLYDKGWHSRPDYKDSANTVLVSAAWYADTAQRSNDWLISPAIVVDENTCFSWYAYSQDPFFPERYDVLVGTNPTDTTSFRRLLTVAEEAYVLNYRSLNLSDSVTAGSVVHVAFRHASKDKFLLVLDDIRVSQVKARDVGPVDFKDIVLLDGGDSTRFRFSVRNYGLDTLVADSALVLNYRVNDGPVRSYTLPDSVVLAPNDTIKVVNQLFWKSDTMPGYYRVCIWTSGVADDDALNDTTCAFILVETPVGSQPQVAALAFSAYPSPTTGLLHVTPTRETARYSITLLAPDGRTLVHHADCKGQQHLSLEALPSGIYWLNIQDDTDTPTRLCISKQ